nr:nodulation protein W, putative [Tanacetum cinerariifolium]
RGWSAQDDCDEMRPPSLSRRAAITRRETPTDSPSFCAAADHPADDCAGLRDDAIRGLPGRFYGIGSTTGEPGYYLAHGLEEKGKIIGVAVIKVRLEALEERWQRARLEAFYYWWPLNELVPLERESIADGVEKLTFPANTSVDHEHTVVSYLAQTRELADTPWHLTLLTPLEDLRREAANQGMLVAVACALVAFLLIAWNERRKVISTRLAAREALEQANNELERRITDRTADLRASNERLKGQIRERRQAEETLRQAQDELIQAGKLAAIGQMSTSIAHELNQPLAALRTLSGNTVRFLERGALDTASANLRTINDLVDRMGRITASLRAFARRGEDKGQASLGKAVEAALQLLGARLDNASLALHQQIDDVELAIDQTRLEQILVNLIGNALDAMSAQPMPILWLEGDMLDGRYRLAAAAGGTLNAEDPAEGGTMFVLALALEDIHSQGVASAEEALALVGEHFAGIVISDIRLPGIDGLELLKRLKERDRTLPVVLITGHGDVSMAVGAMRDGAYDFMEKPFSPERLVDVARRALEQRGLAREVWSLRRQLAERDSLEGKIIGRSQAMQALRARRHDHQFVALNCGGLPESLFESEIFGHEANAFTGAGKRRIGKIEHAHNGTLFLDEVESMPINLQIKLLRVLQERTLERLGSNQSQSSLRFDREPPSLDSQTRSALLAHDWPGNVRELRNVAERYALGLPAFKTAGTQAATPSLDFAEAVEAFEKNLLGEALRRSGGNLSQASQELGMAKTTLFDKVKKYGLG